MKKKILKHDTLNEIDFKRVYINLIYPRDSKYFTDRGFVKIDNGQMGGTHWTCCNIKYNKLFYFHRFEGAPAKLLISQFPKSIFYHNYKVQDKNSRLCEQECELIRWEGGRSVEVPCVKIGYSEPT